MVLPHRPLDQMGDVAEGVVGHQAAQRQRVVGGHPSPLRVMLSRICASMVSRVLRAIRMFRYPTVSSVAPDTIASVPTMARTSLVRSRVRCDDQRG